MSWFKKSTPEVSVQREMRRTDRELINDRKALERKEKEIEMEIKKLAKSGQRDACAILAKTLVQIRKQKAKNINMSAKMSAIGAQQRNAYSAGKMVNVVGKTAETMKEINKQMDPKTLVKQMRDFTTTQEQSRVTDEIVSETMDAMLDESGDDAEQDAIISQVLDEIGIDLNAQLSKLPKAPMNTSSATVESNKQVDDSDLEKALNNLRY